MGSTVPLYMLLILIVNPFVHTVRVPNRRKFRMPHMGRKHCDELGAFTLFQWGRNVEHVREGSFGGGGDAFFLQFTIGEMLGHI